MYTAINKTERPWPLKGVHCGRARGHFKTDLKMY